MKWKKIRSVFDYILTTVLFITLLLTLFLVLSSKITDDTGFFGYQSKVVLSGSMEPELKTGSVIFIKTGGDLTRFKKGDIITFEEDNILITHRIVQSSESGKKYITKGDANNEIDLNPVLDEDIIGEFKGVSIPYIGYVTNLANSKEGTALLLILPGFLLITYSFITIWGVIRKVEREKIEMNEKG